MSEEDAEWLRGSFKVRKVKESFALALGNWTKSATKLSMEVIHYSVS